MNVRSFTLFARKSLQILGVLALVLTIALTTQVGTAFAQSCDPADGVSCWKLDYDHKIATWQGPTDGSADVYQKGAVLGLVRDGWTVKIPDWQVPGNVEICVGTVDVNGYHQTKWNCDGTELSIKAGDITVTDSTGDSGGFRIKPAFGYGYNGGTISTPAPTSTPTATFTPTPTPTNTPAAVEPSPMPTEDPSRLEVHRIEFTDLDILWIVVVVLTLLVITLIVVLVVTRKRS